MELKFNGGVWPVMLTPFTDDNQIDYEALEGLIEWYVEKGVSGLFAVCQSSEMFFLSEQEKVEIASFVKEKVKNRVPVIASGHTATNLEEHVRQVLQMAQTGVDAVILIANRLAKLEDDESVLLKNIYTLLDRLPEDLPLGIYECPYPYKRLLTSNTLKEIADTGRFYFLKETSCDVSTITEKIKATQNTNLKIYNANAATLLESLIQGAVGFSGVMANFQPELYVWLTKHYKNHPQKANELQHFLTVSSLIERQKYPISAKYYLNLEGIAFNTLTRIEPEQQLTATEKLEVEHLYAMTKQFKHLFFHEK